MKRTILTAAILGFAFTQCKRDYTCLCTVNFSGTISSTTTKFNNTKSKATDDCNALNSTMATQTVTCALN